MHCFSFVVSMEKALLITLVSGRIAWPLFSSILVRIPTASPNLRALMTWPSFRIMALAWLTRVRWVWAPVLHSPPSTLVPTPSNFWRFTLERAARMEEFSLLQAMWRMVSTLRLTIQSVCDQSQHSLFLIDEVIRRLFCVKLSPTRWNSQSQCNPQAPVAPFKATSLWAIRS